MTFTNEELEEIDQIMYGIGSRWLDVDEKKGLMYLEISAKAKQMQEEK